MSGSPSTTSGSWLISQLGKLTNQWQTDNVLPSRGSPASPLSLTFYLFSFFCFFNLFYLSLGIFHSSTQPAQVGSRVAFLVCFWCQLKMVLVSTRRQISRITCPQVGSRVAFLPSRRSPLSPLIQMVLTSVNWASLARLDPAKSNIKRRFFLRKVQSCLAAILLLAAFLCLISNLLFWCSKSRLRLLAGGQGAELSRSFEMFVIFQACAWFQSAWKFIKCLTKYVGNVHIIAHDLWMKERMSQWLDGVGSDGVTARPKRSYKWGGLRNHESVSEWRRSSKDTSTSENPCSFFHHQQGRTDFNKERISWSTPCRRIDELGNPSPPPVVFFDHGSGAGASGSSGSWSNPCGNFWGIF